MLCVSCPASCQSAKLVTVATVNACVSRCSTPTHTTGILSQVPYYSNLINMVMNGLWGGLLLVASLLIALEFTLEGRPDSEAYSTVMTWVSSNACSVADVFIQLKVATSGALLSGMIGQLHGCLEGRPFIEAYSTFMTWVSSISGSPAGLCRQLTVAASAVLGCLVACRRCQLSVP
jgi:hypothetical protein